MGLRDRLAALGMGGAAQPPSEVEAQPAFRDRFIRLGGSTERAEEDPRIPLEAMEGAQVCGSGGEAFIRIDRAAEVSPTAWIRRWHADHVRVLTRDARVTAADPSRVLFLDTETTGLGGAACLVFLIGGIHLQDGHPILTQFLMPGPTAERAMLKAFHSFLERFELLVTYNGRAFDAKVLRDRFVMKRLRKALPLLDAFPHLDLLHPARRIWQLSLPDCRLATLEREVLGRGRARDIEGWLIPAAYYEFLQTGRTQKMHDVVAHNAYDLETLYLLAARVLAMVADPTGEADDDTLELSGPPPRMPAAEQMLGLGTLLASGGATERGRSALECATAGGSAVNRYLARKRLAQIHKRAGALEQAAGLWAAMIDEGAVIEAHPYDELAKYHEHGRRDYDAALQVVRRALDCLPPACAEQRAALEHRQARLQCKLGI